MCIGAFGVVVPGSTVVGVPFAFMSSGSAAQGSVSVGALEAVVRGVKAGGVVPRVFGNVSPLSFALYHVGVHITWGVGG